MQEASADVIEQTVSLPMAVEYDTNATLVNSNARSVTRSITTPRYKLISGNGISEMSADFAFSIERSSDQSVRLDRDDPSLALLWRTEFPRGSMSLRASYDQTSILVSELADTGLVQAEGTRRNQNLNASYSHFLTDRLALSLNGGYTQVRYSGGTLVNSQQPSVSTMLDYQYSDVLKPFFQVSFSKFQPDNQQPGNQQPDSDYLAAVAGAVWQWSDRLDLTFNAGMNRIKAGQNDTGFQGEFRLKHLYERYLTTVGLARSIAPSGIGGFIESDTLQAGVAYDLTGRSGLGSDFAIRKVNGLDKSEFSQLNLFYRYSINPEWDMRVNTQFRSRTDAFDNTATGKLLGFTLNYVNPKF
ncbi:MAG: hypothetical protein Q8M99_09615 [Methylotenera sp.]|nr:hypothetical protein [Methylotenera sp.]